jgi:5-amino-6-(5-phosphoribosylamino)uracil reductase
VTVLRLLLPGTAVVGDLSDDRNDVLGALADLYAYPMPVPVTGWVRANMVSTLDGSATGPNGLSGTISSAADKAVFGVLRGLADVVLVGAGTVRAEGYRAFAAKPAFADRRAAAGQSPVPALAVVTRSGTLDPNDLAPHHRDVPDGRGCAALSQVLVITCAAGDVAGLRSSFGSDRVLVAGEDDVDPAVAVAHLAARGLGRVLLEGGPSLLGRTIRAGRLDELCLTTSPLLVAGDGPRIAADASVSDVRLRAAHLLEAEGVLLGRWLVQREGREVRA